jgi:hypothetical protein
MMDQETRDRLIERAAHALVTVLEEQPWGDLARWVQDSYRHQAAAAIDSLGIEAVPHPFEMYVAEDGHNSFCSRKDLFAIRAAATEGVA